MSYLFNTIDRYIAIHVLKGWMLILLVVIVLFSFLELVNQLDDVGDGSYKIVDAFLFVLLTIPKRITMLTPVSAMVGSVIALVGLSNSGELMAMRAAGMSIRRIVISLLKVGVLILLAALVFEQWIAPSLEQQALRMHSMKTSGLSLAGGDGFWSRNKQIFVRIGDIQFGRLPSDIEIFEFKESHQLVTYIRADVARLQQNGEWVLTNASVKHFHDKSIDIIQHNNFSWKTFLSTTEIRALEFPIDSLSIGDLSGYVSYLKRVGEPYQDHRHQLWKKISRPFSAAVMVLLASLFAFGSHRSPNKGKRIIQATVVALMLYFTSEIVANAGILFGANPILTAILPILIIISIVILQLKRTF
ncbi:MAG: LPS export ABC transporter permease LptG [Methylococcales bacterium]